MSNHWEWEKAHKHSFNHSLVAGREGDGRELFVTQVMRREVSVGADFTIDDSGNVTWSPSFSSWESAHLGKAGVHLAQGCTYSWGGKEYDAPRGDHYVLKVSDPGRFRWVQASGGVVPTHAVPGWNRIENQFVARIPWGGGVHPGKLIPSSRATYIGYGGGEKASQSYEVLVCQP